MHDLAGIVAKTPHLDRPTLVAVDGVDGSGKTTFAEALATAYSASGRPVTLVHLDDFLNPRSVRHHQGSSSPIGFFEDSYDLAAFQSNVLRSVHEDPPILVRRRVFDHRSDRSIDDPPVEVPRGGIVLVEGMFLHRDELQHEWDLSILLDVPFTVTFSRMAVRDGANPDPEHPSNRRYVQGQRHYFATCDPCERATIVLDNS